MSFAKHLLPLAIFIFSLYFFTFKLGGQSLAPWDEAWYATIARNIVRSPDLLHLTFNGQPYSDHPPLGFYFLATSFQLLGINEFTARLPMAILGSLAVAAVFLAGKKLGSIWVGTAAALILLSSRWFVIRSRTANLEAPLLLTQILTFYFFTQPTSTWQLLAGWFSLSLALLVKSTISLTLFPLALWSTIDFIRRRGHAAKVALLSGLCLVLPLLPWYSANYLALGPKFISHSLVEVGLRGGTTQGVSWATSQRTLLYLRSAMHKWYLPLLASLALSLLFIRRWKIRWTASYLLLSALPYFLSSQTHIWHLLPILPPAALLIAYTAFSLPLPQTVWLGGFLAVFAISYSSYWPEFIDLPPIISNEAKIGLATKANSVPIVSQDTTYLPTLVFYADREVTLLPLEHKLDQYPRPFQLVTHTYLLNKGDYRLTYQLGDTVVAVRD